MANTFGNVTALSGNANNSANLSYTSLGIIDFGANPPGECFVEVTLQASSATAGNKQAVLYLRTSLDGTQFSAMPSATQAPNSKQFGAVSLPDATQVVSTAFPISAVLNGGLTPKVEIIVFNDCGVAFASIGQTARYRTEIFG